MPGLLNPQGMGLLNGQALSPGWMNMPQGQASPYGSDAWAMNTGGPGALLMRQVVRGMAGKGNPLAFLDANQAAKFFTPETIGYLAPQYQAGFKKDGKR